MFGNKNVYFLRESQNNGKEKKWDERFFLDKIPPYDAYKDENYLSLGLIKSKIKYENLLERERSKKKKLKKNYCTEHFLIDSQPKKKLINKKLIFSVNNNKEKKNIDISKKSYSMTYSHGFGNYKNYLTKTINYKLNKKNDNGENKLTLEEADLLEEFEIIKVLWNKFGVTKKYQENFSNFLNSLEKKESIKHFLELEKKQMQKFKYDLTQLLKKIIHRNDEICKLKQLIRLYINILNEKKYYFDIKNENFENLSLRNEKKVISDINDCLITVRINTLNVVNQIKNFLLTNSYYFYMNKIDLNKIKNDYYYNDEYLLSIKNDLDFVQNSAMENLYDFDYFGGGDPFFLSFTKFPGKNDSNSNTIDQKIQKLKLPINEKMLNEIQNCLFFLNQAELLNKTKNNTLNKNRIIDFLKNNNNINNTDNNGKNSNDNLYGLGNTFKGNLERNIVQLKMQRGYDKLFTFITNENNLSQRGNKFKSYSYKKKNKDLPFMTSQELKEKFNEYESINSLLFDEKNEKNDNIREEEDFKKRDEEIIVQKSQNSEKNLKENKKIKNTKNEEDEYERELEEIKDVEHDEEEDEQTKKLKEKELKSIEKEKQKKEEIYEINWFTDSLDELTYLYNEYLSKIKKNIKESFYFPEKGKYFIKQIYPKIIIAKKNKEKNNKIYGICGIYYYIDKNNNLILKIHHISSIENKKEIFSKFIDLIENTLNYKILEFELKNNIKKTNDIIEVNNIFIDIGFKESEKNEEKKILRKENKNREEKVNELVAQIKYDSLSILSLIDNNENLEKNNIKKFNCFNNIINEINLILLINSLKNNDKYKIEILKASFYSFLIEKLSKLENDNFDFIKLINNNCLNIDEITNNALLPEEQNYYAIINNCLNIQLYPFMTLNIDNYLYNGIEINIKNSLTKDTKYMNNLFFLPTLNKNINIIIYQYNNSFEKDFFNKNNNIYTQFISLFKYNISIMKIKEKEDNDDDNKKILWIPSFNIDTNLFSSKLNINKDICIKNEENSKINIREFNDFFKINYLPDKNKDKNIKININNNEDIIIKDKFILGIYHQEFMDKLDIPVIALINITSDNFIKS